MLLEIIYISAKNRHIHSFSQRVQTKLLEYFPFLWLNEVGSSSFCDIRQAEICRFAMNVCVCLRAHDR